MRDVGKGGSGNLTHAPPPCVHPVGNVRAMHIAPSSRVPHGASMTSPYPRRRNDETSRFQEFPPPFIPFPRFFCASPTHADDYSTTRDNRFTHLVNARIFCNSPSLRKKRKKKKNCSESSALHAYNYIYSEENKFFPLTDFFIRYRIN